jgi:hypothetical protein
MNRDGMLGKSLRHLPWIFLNNPRLCLMVIVEQGAFSNLKKAAKNLHTIFILSLITTKEDYSPDQYFLRFAPKKF